MLDVVDAIQGGIDFHDDPDKADMDQGVFVVVHWVVEDTC